MIKFLKKNYYILIIFTLIIYLEPQGFKEDFYPILGQIDWVYKILKIVTFYFIFGVYFNKLLKKQIKINRLITAVIIYQIICVFSTIINNGDFIRFIGPALTTINLVMIAEIIISDKKIEYTLEKVNIYLRICFIINLISIILVDAFEVLPNTKIYFLGIDNRWIFTYLPWITFEFLYAKLKGNSLKKPIIVFALCEMTLLYKISLAAMLVNLLWIIVCINKLNDKVTRFAIFTYIATFFANILIVVCKIQNLFKYFLNNILKKGTTLSGRTYLWDKVLNDLNGNFVLGHGMQNINYDKDYFYNSNPYNLKFLAVGHPHNTYMTNLYRFGILGLISYMIIWIIVFIKLQQNKKNKLANILFISLVISLILGIFDTIDYSALFFILTFAYNIDRIEFENKVEKIKHK